ncbi:MAG: alpha/beta fold hydrolase [Chloroflexi bacterium]|nr:alpha/beta fold hydrolase [Chloroflexota bacterium]
MREYQRSPAGFGEDPFSQDPSVQISNTPLWREGLFAFDWLALRSSPVYYGCGVPRGHGEPVVVVPGFLATDASLIELHAWLARIGYRPYFSDIGRNADCPNYIAGNLLGTVKRAYEECGSQPVRIVGHSLGGMLARSVALDYPEYVALVISMGSPFKDAVRAHPAVIAAADSLRRGRGAVGQNIGPACFSGHCTCSFVKNMLNPEVYQVPHFAIYSKYDGVVEWESCLEDDDRLNDEVNCTHIGMAFHPGVYRALARRLRQAR